MQPSGHLDFYPNGGENQPGCHLSDRLMAAFRNASYVFNSFEDLVACNHMRAIDLFTDSIFTVCQPVAYECNSNEAFLKVCRDIYHPSPSHVYTNGSNSFTTLLTMRYGS